MTTLARTLIAASAGIALFLGILHLVLTFRGPKLHPRDAALETEMRQALPVITSETTMWKAWIGFNASHSFSLMLFGLVCGYLALAHGTFLFRSPFLLLVGLMLLAGYIFLAKVYFFSGPLRAVALAITLYAAALLVGYRPERWLAE